MAYRTVAYWSDALTTRLNETDDLAAAQHEADKYWDAYGNPQLHHHLDHVFVFQGDDVVYRRTAVVAPSGWESVDTSTDDTPEPRYLCERCQRTTDRAFGPCKLCCDEQEAAESVIPGTQTVDYIVGMTAGGYGDIAVKSFDSFDEALAFAREANLSGCAYWIAKQTSQIVYRA